jgi:hypothetical protein
VLSFEAVFNGRARPRWAYCPSERAPFGLPAGLPDCPGLKRCAGRSLAAVKSVSLMIIERYAVFATSPSPIVT